MPLQVHLVGSVGLETAGDVFAAVGPRLGRYLKRMTDGETGPRRDWFLWQYPLLRASPFLRSRDDVHVVSRMPLLELRPGVKPGELRIGELSYAREARASYEDFVAARNNGTLPNGIRFQITLPTPFAVVGAFVAADSRAAVGHAYQDAMIREIAAICDRIPHRDLCIQFDVCIEMLFWDGGFDGTPPFPGMEQAFAAQFAAMGPAVPNDVELGFHLCYGDYEGHNEVEPRDTSKLVGMAELIARNVKRPVAYFHMPVPESRSDDAFFAPLGALKLPVETELYLGLVHAADGAAGARRRMAAARKYVKNFGIASPCGLSRCKTPDVVLQLLGLHAEVAAAG